MPDVPPDRLSNNPASPFYDEAVLRRGVGIRFKGVERTNVEEYCVSEGWVRVRGRQDPRSSRQSSDHEDQRACRALLSEHVNGRSVGNRHAFPRKCRRTRQH